MFPKSPINEYLSTSFLATLSTKADVGFSMYEYTWVTKSLTISFLTSQFKVFSKIADIILVCSYGVWGMQNSRLEEDEISEKVGVDERESMLQD